MIWTYLSYSTFFRGLGLDKNLSGGIRSCPCKSDGFLTGKILHFCAKSPDDMGG